MNNADMPAMPQSATRDGYGCNYSGYDGSGVPTGLTKREMMAMHMMAAMLVDTDAPNVVYCASIAINAADQLIFELERTRGESK